MAVYFKFKSSKNSDSVPFDGPFISVANLRNVIVAKYKLAKLDFFDLVISNAVTNEEYVDEEFLVPKHTSLVVRRTPRPSFPAKCSSATGVTLLKSDSRISKTLGKNVQQSSAYDALDDDFGDDVYNVPKICPPPVPPAFDGLDNFSDDVRNVPDVVLPPVPSRSDREDDKIKARVEASAFEWQRQAGNRVPEMDNSTKGTGTSLPLRREYRQGFEKKIPPPGYICHRCEVAGHFIQHCPTNGDPDYNKKKIRPPTGIPRSMLDIDPEGTYFLPTGQVAVMKPNESAFERELAFLPSSTRQTVGIPPELCCPLCKEVLKDAVLTSKCCFKSYCDKCIRKEIIAKAKCVCGATNVLADDLLPNKTLREALDRLLEPSQISSITSSDNAGNRASASEKESARYAHSKLSFPAISVVSAPGVESDGFDRTKGPVAPGKGAVERQTAASVKQSLEDDDGSVESRLRKEEEPVQEIVTLEKPVMAGTQLWEGPRKSEAAKGKKPAAKRKRQENMVQLERGFRQGPNYNNFNVENYCVHCGSYGHPSWNCYLMNGPGAFHHPPAMPGAFGPGFGPEMMRTMPPAVGGGYLMPSHYYPHPYDDYRPVIPHAGMKKEWRRN